MSMIYVSNYGKKTLLVLGPDFKSTWRTACKAYLPQKEISNSKKSKLFILVFQTSLLFDITVVEIFVFLKLTALHLNFSPSEFRNLLQSARIILFIFAIIVIAVYMLFEVNCLSFRFFFLESFDLIFISRLTLESCR